MVVCASAALLLGGRVQGITVGALLARSETQFPRGPVIDGPLPLVVRSTPAGAIVVLDGKLRGHTPLELRTSVGVHTLFVAAERRLEASELVNVEGRGATADITLWNLRPRATRLRPAYPGAQIADANFLADGRVQTLIAFPDGQPGLSAGTIREAWLAVETTHGGLASRPVGPRAPLVAVSPDGQRIAMVRETPQAGSAGRAASSAVWGRRLDSVWVGSAESRTGFGTPVFRLADVGGGTLGSVSHEELASVAWLPDARRLLVAVRQGDRATGGPHRTRLLLVDAGADGLEQTDSPPEELIVVPAQVLLETAQWSPDGRRVALLVRAAGASGGKSVVGLSVLQLDDESAARFQYVADVGQDGSARARSPVAPVAWEPCSSAMGCGDESRLAYSAPVPGATSVDARGPFGLLGFRAQPAASPSGLFLATLSNASVNAGSIPRLGKATSAVAPAWRSGAEGFDGAPFVGFVRGSDAAFVARAIDVASGDSREVDLKLPSDVAAGATSVGVRWDLARGRALIIARAAERAPASGHDPVNVWLIDFGSI